jgi:hypothetical protein
VGENPLNWSDHTGQNPDVPPEQLPVPPTVVPAESGTLPEVPTIIPAADPSNTSSPNSSDPDNPQQPQTQQPDANAGACTSIEHAGTATAGLGGVAFLCGSVTDAGVVTAPIGVSMQLSGGIGMAVGGITYAIGDAGIYFGLCN